MAQLQGTPVWLPYVTDADLEGSSAYLLLAPHVDVACPHTSVLSVQATYERLRSV